MSFMLKLKVDATSGTINIPQRIPAQRITLTGYKIQFDTDAHAKLAQVLTFSTSWLSNVIDGTNTTTTDTHSRVGYPLLMGNTQIEVRDCQYSIVLNKEIPRTFAYNVYGKDLTGFLGLDLIFQYNTQG